MKESLPVMNYNGYEETAFDVVPVLEGVVGGVVVFGVLTLARADGMKGSPNPEKVYGGRGQDITAVVHSTTSTSVKGTVRVLTYHEAFGLVESDRLAEYMKTRNRILLDRGAATAVMLAGKHPPIPVQKPKPIIEPVVEPKPAPVVPQSPVTMTELLLQLAAMQQDFDLRMQVMAKRLATLEAK